MHVIAHEAIRVEATLGPRNKPAQVKKIKLSVLDSEEAVSLVVAPLDNMHGNTREHDARASRHEAVNGPTHAPLTEKNVVRP
jgi:hypothetical protein